MRIIDFEDEWPTVRSIPHWLHDKIFQKLPPEEAVELELREEERPKDKIPATISVSLKVRNSPRQMFEYVFVTDTAALRELAKKDDIVIVDVMRDVNSRFVSILDDLIPIFGQDEFNPKDNWRYFSNYHERVAESSALQGFMKKQRKELVDYLYGKVMDVWNAP